MSNDLKPQAISDAKKRAASDLSQIEETVRREIEETYTEPKARAAYRAGMSSAAAVCDALGSKGIGDQVWRLRQMVRVWQPDNCPLCASERKSPGFETGGWLQLDNNGPIVPCALCNPNGEHPRS